MTVSSALNPRAMLETMAEVPKGDPARWIADRAMTVFCDCIQHHGLQMPKDDALAECEAVLFNALWEAFGRSPT